MTSGETVVTGVGAICAAGRSVDRIMHSMYSGQRNPGPPRHIRVALDKTYPVFEVDQPLQELRKASLDHEPTRTCQLVLIAAEGALNQAGLDPDDLKRRRVGVSVGTTVGCTLNDEGFYRDLRAGARPGLQPVHRYLSNNPALFLAEVLGVSGPVATVANACSSGTDAIGLARAWIETDQCDIALAGGGDELSRIPYLGFIRLLISSQQPCRPFDRNRDGLNLGEGAGVIVLERESTARDRGATALASIDGYGSFSDAFHPTGPHPEGLGLGRAFRHALREAGVTPERVGFVNSHGTATPDNDLVEGRVLRNLFRGGVPIVATKSYTGHALGAAGGLEAVFTVQALLDQRLPPTLGFEELDDEIGVEPTGEGLAIEADVAVSDSLAFGGNNAVLVFRRRH